MTIGGVLGMPGVLGVVAVLVIGSIWFVLTVGILCLMEVGRLSYRLASMDEN